MKDHITVDNTKYIPVTLLIVVQPATTTDSLSSYVRSSSLQGPAEVLLGSKGPMVIPLIPIRRPNIPQSLSLTLLLRAPASVRDRPTRRGASNETIFYWWRHRQRCSASTTTRWCAWQPITKCTCIFEAGALRRRVEEKACGIFQNSFRGVRFWLTLCMSRVKRSGPF